MMQTSEIVTGTLTIFGDTVECPMLGYAGFACQITGVWTGIISFQGTIDGTTWQAISVTTAFATYATIVGWSDSWNQDQLSGQSILYGYAAGLVKVRIKAELLSSGTPGIRFATCVTFNKTPAIFNEGSAVTLLGTNLVGHNTTLLLSGRKIVTTAGTRVTLASSTTAKWVIITAETDNTGIVVVGSAASVIASLATREGIPLSHGDSIALLIDNLADVGLDSTVSGDGVTYIYGG